MSCAAGRQGIGIADDSFASYGKRYRCNEASNPVLIPHPGALKTPPEIVQQRKPSRKVLERLERIESLPRRKQDAILMTIDHFLNSAAG
jgi:hypothetical protein